MSPEQIFEVIADVMTSRIARKFAGITTVECDDRIRNLIRNGATIEQLLLAIEQYDLRIDS